MEIRIGNIKYVNSQDTHQIVKVEINQYYGSEDKLISEGYERIDHPDGSFRLVNTFHSIDHSCFKNPESCYTVATIEYDNHEGFCNLTTVGDRLLKLKKQDRKDFFKVYKIVDKVIRKTNNN